MKAEEMAGRWQDEKARKREIRGIVDAILAGRVRGEAELEALKRKASARLALSSLPSNADILAMCRPDERERLKMLVRKPTRTLSGVAVIAAMTSPARCPHGICVPCPGGISCPSPQSYTGREPAALRAAQHGFDPYRQVTARLAQLDEIGHSLDKAELIIMGGTITDRPPGYQHWFVSRCLQAMNDYPGHGGAFLRGTAGFRTFGVERPPMRQLQSGTSAPHSRPGRTAAVPGTSPACSASERQRLSWGCRARGRSCCRP